jgi:hypothetical protein
VTVRGIVTEQNSGNRPLGGVQITVLGSAPEVSDNAGAFALAFPGKKPGERIVVTGVSKTGYEIVNRDALANWLIPADPRARTKIVMCPEGALARNILKYYELSQAALTRGYDEQLRRLQAQRDSARIDARTFGEQAKILADRFASQETRLEELAERFARENFDDCSTVHRQAFEAFAQGRIDEALRILESVNSAEEIAKAKAQKEKGVRLVTEGQGMLAESDSIIRQNIDKLLFQGDLYAASNRFDEADSAYATAARADTTYFKGVDAYAEFLLRQRHMDRAARWMPVALAAARSEHAQCDAMVDLALLDRFFHQYRQAEQRLLEALDVARRMEASDPQHFRSDLAMTLTQLASVRRDMRMYPQAEENALEAVALRRELSRADPESQVFVLPAALRSLALIHEAMGQRVQAVGELREALAIYRSRNAASTRSARVTYASALNELGFILMQMSSEEYPEAEQVLSENLALCRKLAAENPEAYLEKYAIAMENLAQAQGLLRHDEEAERNRLEAISMFRELAAENPLVHQHPLASSMENLSLFYFDRRQYEKAERVGSAALAIRREQAAINPHTFSFYLSALLSWLGSVYWADRKPDTADALNGECLALLRDMTAKDSSAFLRSLAYRLEEIAWEQHTERLSQAIARTSESIALLQLALAKNMDVSRMFSLACGRMARYMILTRQFTEAETYARLDIAHSSDSTASKKNLAHSLLYQGRFEEAAALYRELQDAVMHNRTPCRAAVLEDFDAFERAGITHPDIAKIRALLTGK